MYLYRNWVKWMLIPISILFIIFAVYAFGTFSYINKYQSLAGDNDMMTCLTAWSPKTITTAVLVGTDEENTDVLSFGYKSDNGQVIYKRVPALDIKGMSTVVDVMYLEEEPDVCVLYKSYQVAKEYCLITFMLFILFIFVMFIMPIFQFRMYSLGNMNMYCVYVDEIKPVKESGFVETFFFRFLKPVRLRVSVFEKGENVVFTDKHFISRLTNTFRIKEGDIINVYYCKDTNRCIARIK